MQEAAAAETDVPKVGHKARAWIEGLQRALAAYSQAKTIVDQIDSIGSSASSSDNDSDTESSSDTGSVTSMYQHYLALLTLCPDFVTDFIPEEREAEIIIKARKAAADIAMQYGFYARLENTLLQDRLHLAHDVLQKEYTDLLEGRVYAEPTEVGFSETIRRTLADAKSAQQNTAQQQVARLKDMLRGAKPHQLDKLVDAFLTIRLQVLENFTSKDRQLETLKKQLTACEKKIKKLYQQAKDQQAKAGQVTDVKIEDAYQALLALSSDSGDTSSRGRASSESASDSDDSPTPSAPQSRISALGPHTISADSSAPSKTAWRVSFVLPITGILLAGVAFTVTYAVPTVATALVGIGLGSTMASAGFLAIPGALLVLAGLVLLGWNVYRQKVANKVANDNTVHHGKGRADSADGFINASELLNQPYWGRDPQTSGSFQRAPDSPLPHSANPAPPAKP